ncbi:MAG: AtpZ/AtpI family protein [Phycisphaerae bacterium]|nr:AtpZ/AtpI family protein [Phycisphaerae bacterium]
MRGLDPARQERETRVGWKMAGAAMQTSSEVAAGVALGWLVDHFGGTRPWGLLVGGCVGIVVALATLMRIAWKMNKEMDRNDAETKTGSSQAEHADASRKNQP